MKTTLAARVSSLHSTSRTYSLDYWLPVLVVLVPVAGLALITAGLSLRWDQILDSPVFVYLGYLMTEHGTVPYRDVYDVNLPGTYVVYAAVVKLLGTSDLSVRIGDLTCLAAVSVSTWFFIRRISSIAAVLAVAIFCLFHLSAGPGFALERDFIVLVPLGLTLV